MIDRLFNLFENLVRETDSATEEDNNEITLAATALMFEVARSDQVKQHVELAAIESILAETLHISSDRIGELVNVAEENVESAHDLYQFTQIINDVFDYRQKKQLVLAMWQVAFADGHVEAIEDHIIRRVAGLVHVAHGDFILLKVQARTMAEQQAGV